MRLGAAVLALVVSATPWFPAAAEDGDGECRAQVTSELIRQEEQDTGTHLTWQVHVTTEQACVVVEFKLILTLQKPDSEVETVVRLGRVRLSEGGIDHQMWYEMSADDVLADWKIVQSSCEPCAVDEPD